MLELWKNVFFYKANDLICSDCITTVRCYKCGKKTTKYTYHEENTYCDECYNKCSHCGTNNVLYDYEINTLSDIISEDFKKDFKLIDGQYKTKLCRNCLYDLLTIMCGV